MSKIGKNYLMLTFLIMIVCWGGCFICSINGITLSEYYILYIPFLLGGWSPTISSYLVLRKNGEVKNFKEWLRNVFDFKHSMNEYLMVVAFCILYIVSQCLISGYSNGTPLVSIIIMIPMMLFGGGLEEAGWRYILQPQLEKRYSFTVATIIVGFIWWLWHLPLFYINGVGQYGGNYIAFGISVMGLSFALAGIKKITKSVWLCVLFHCIINSLSGIYLVNEDIRGNIASSVLLIAATYFIIMINNKKLNLTSLSNGSLHISINERE